MAALQWRMDDFTAEISGARRHHDRNRFRFTQAIFSGSTVYFRRSIATTLHCATAIPEERGLSDHPRRAGAKAGTGAQADGGTCHRRHSSDGRHLSAIFHWHPLVGRRTHVRVCAARERLSLSTCAPHSKKDAHASRSRTLPADRNRICALGRKMKVRINSSPKD